MNNTTELLDSNWTNSKTLLELNSEEALNRLPVIIFISVLILLGIMGKAEHFARNFILEYIRI
jgi:hypothetical protein